MKVTILEPSGYCSGVQRAIDLAVQTKEKYKNRNVVVLGMLVHNKQSLKTLRNKKIRTIFKEGCSIEQLADKIKKPSVVILTAHGHDKSIEDYLVNKGHIIVDATCPFVENSFKEIEKVIKNKGAIFYIGVENHPESKAALSISKDVHFINLKKPSIPVGIKKEIVVISQTTLSKIDTKFAISSILNKYPKAKIINGICSSSTKRQESILNIKEKVDMLYVVGDLNSNNTKTLYLLAKENKNILNVKLIENEKKINKKDLLGLSNVVIASGASTPKEIINKVRNRII